MRIGLEFAQMIDTSASSLDYVLSVLRLPREFQGTRILDLGAGQTDTVAWLNANGANAFAVDPRYANLAAMNSELEERVYPWLRDNQYNGGNSLEWEMQLEAMRQTHAAWQADIRANSSHYIAACACDLPFASESFDEVYSLNSLIMASTMAPEVFDAAIAEGLRVLKFGGQLQLHPMPKQYWETVLTAPGIAAQNNRAEILPNKRGSGYLLSITKTTA